jgi:hypothetical protein
MLEPRLVRSPLAEEMLAPIESGCDLVVVGGELTDNEYGRVARLLEDHPAVTLRVRSDQTTLDFLRHFPRLRRFDAAIPRLESWTGLAHLPAEAEDLSLGATKKTLSLSIIGRFRNLRKLYLEGQRKDISVLAELGTLEDLTLRSITLPDLSLLTGLKRLWSLDIKLGGTRNLALLPRLESLKYLELWGVRGLTDVTPIPSTTSLQFLFLQDLSRVRTVPPLVSMINLRRVWIETLNELMDVCSIARAPALEEFSAVAMRHLEPQNFRCFLAHPTLRYLNVGFGSLPKNAELSVMFPTQRHGQLPPFEFR